MYSFSRSAPSPVLLAALGWYRISNCLDVERCSLLMCIARSSKTVISAVAHAAKIQRGSWLHFAARGINQFLLDGPSTSWSEWLELTRRIKLAPEAREHEAIISLSQRHANTAHYTQVRRAPDKVWSFTNFRHTRGGSKPST